MRTNSYGFGIARRSRRRPYIAKVKRNRRTIYLGSFFTIAEARTAVEAYVNAHPNKVLRL